METVECILWNIQITLGGVILANIMESALLDTTKVKCFF